MLDAAPIAVTGATGYVGGRVMAELGARGRALVRAPVSWLRPDAQHRCDLLVDTGAVPAAIGDARTVIHLAGHNEVVARTDPDRALHETTAMAETLADAAAKAGAERIVYVSTVHVYGDSLKPGERITEATSIAPLSPYAQARVQCEEILADRSGCDVVSLRLTNAVGAPAHPAIDRWSLVATDLCLRAVLDRVAALHSPGMQSRDFITLSAAVRGIVGACAPSVPPGVYNLSSGRSTTIRALAELVQDRVHDICGWRPSLDAPPVAGPADDPYLVDPSRLASHGLVSDEPIGDGIDEIIRHCRDNEDELRKYWRLA